jgi:hypothetical protein
LTTLAIAPATVVAVAASRDFGLGDGFARAEREAADRAAFFRLAVLVCLTTRFAPARGVVDLALGGLFFESFLEAVFFLVAPERLTADRVTVRFFEVVPAARLLDPRFDTSPPCEFRPARQFEPRQIDANSGTEPTAPVSYPCDISAIAPPECRHLLALWAGSGFAQHRA